MHVDHLLFAFAPFAELLFISDDFHRGNCVKHGYSCATEFDALYVFHISKENVAGVLTNETEWKYVRMTAMAGGRETGSLNMNKVTARYRKAAPINEIASKCLHKYLLSLTYETKWAPIIKR